MVVSEIDSELIDDIRNAGGIFSCNIAEKDRIRVERIQGLEILNPLVNADREKLIRAIAEATELCTALPSYQLYDKGEASVARLLSAGLAKKVTNKDLSSAVVYAAENDTRAASRLQQACLDHHPIGFEKKVTFSETVIGKMCSIVTDSKRFEDKNLVPLTSNSSRAILVEDFNRIFVESTVPVGFNRGLNQFVAKSDLEPFAVAKFLGQNATHAVLGYFAKEKGLSWMSELSDHPDLIERGMKAYIDEVGNGLRSHFPEVNDPLFTETGFSQHASEAVERMMNPFLADPVDRVIRDPVRKLGWEDRLIGAIRLTLRAHVEPVELTRAARLALTAACKERGWNYPEDALDQIWSEIPAEQTQKIKHKILTDF